MLTAMLVIWAVGLAGALVPTIVILKQAVLVIGALRDILRLAHHTRDAARGVAHNVEPVSALAGLRDLLAPVPGAVAGVTTPLGAIATGLEREVAT